jgi:hypothetical protein
MDEQPTAGFIAQEFDEVQKTEHAEWLNLVLKDNPEKWEATYGNLLPVIVKAIQELSIKNEKLEIKNYEIEEVTAELKIKNEKLASAVDGLKIENASLQERLAMYEEIQTMLVKELEHIKSNQQTFKVQIVNSENNNQ